MKILRECIGITTKNPENLINSMELREHNFIFFKKWSIEKFISESIAIEFYNNIEEANKYLDELIEKEQIIEV